MQDLTSLFDLTNPVEGVFTVARVDATEAALDLLDDIRARHGAVSFHHAGGVVSGEGPMCYPKGDLALGNDDIPLGDIDGAQVYVSGKYKDVWRERQLIIDVVQGHGGIFSLDSGLGRKFFVRSRLFNVEEMEELKLTFPGT